MQNLTPFMRELTKDPEEPSYDSVEPWLQFIDSSDKDFSPNPIPLSEISISIFEIIEKEDKKELINSINKSDKNDISSERYGTDNDDPLIFATKRNKTEIAIFLIDTGLNLYYMNNNHHTAMYYAISSNNSVLVDKIKKNRLEEKEFIETEISCLINNIENLNEFIISEFNKFIHKKQNKFISIKNKTIDILNYHIKNKNIIDIITNYYLYTF